MQLLYQTRMVRMFNTVYVTVIPESTLYCGDTNSILQALFLFHFLIIIIIIRNLYSAIMPYQFCKYLCSPNLFNFAYLSSTFLRPCSVSAKGRRSIELFRLGLGSLVPFTSKWKPPSMAVARLMTPLWRKNYQVRKTTHSQVLKMVTGPSLILTSWETALPPQWLHSCIHVLVPDPHG